MKYILILLIIIISTYILCTEHRNTLLKPPVLSATDTGTWYEFGSYFWSSELTNSTCTAGQTESCMAVLWYPIVFVSLFQSRKWIQCKLHLNTFILCGLLDYVMLHSLVDYFCIYALQPEMQHSLPLVLYVVTNVSEEHAASIFSFPHSWVSLHSIRDKTDLLIWNLGKFSFRVMFILNQKWQEIIHRIPDTEHQKNLKCSIKCGPQGPYGK
jgi:hypothetical protein